MGKVNKSKTVTCPFYYVFTAPSKGRFTQIDIPAACTQPRTTDCTYSENLTTIRLRLAAAATTIILSHLIEQAGSSPAQPSPAQPPDTGAGDAAGVKLVLRVLEHWIGLILFPAFHP